MFDNPIYHVKPEKSPVVINQEQMIDTQKEFFNNVDKHLSKQDAEIKSNKIATKMTIVLGVISAVAAIATLTIEIIVNFF